MSLFCSSEEVHGEVIQTIWVNMGEFAARVSPPSWRRREPRGTAAADRSEGRTGGRQRREWSGGGGRRAAPGDGPPGAEP